MRLADNTIKKKWMPLHKTRIKRNCYGFVPRSWSDQTEVLTIQTFRDFILHELRDAQPIKKKPKTTKNPLACKKYSKRNMSPFICHVECVCFMNTCLYGFLVSLEFYFCDTRHGEMCCHINFGQKYFLVASGAIDGCQLWPLQLNLENRINLFLHLSVMQECISTKTGYKN